MKSPTRRRNPAPKPRTYAIARADILRALRADGWDVRENLKVPHATHPSGEFRLWFKTQAIYFTTGDRRRGCGSLSDALSLWIGDIRTMPVAEVLADIERARRQSVGPQRNPSKPSRPDRDEVAIRAWAPGALKRDKREKAIVDEWHGRVLTPGTAEYQRHHAILSNQPKWEEMEGHWILRVPGESIAALPSTGKKTAANFVVFNVRTREELAFLKKSEVMGWLTLRAVNK